MLIAYIFFSARGSIHQGIHQSLSPVEVQSKSLSSVEAKRTSEYSTDESKSLSPFEEKLGAQYYSTVQSKSRPPVEARYSTFETESMSPVEAKLEAKYSTDESKCSLSASENCFSSELKFTSNEQAKLLTVVSKFSAMVVELYHKLFVLENTVREQ